jgi:hypothetical protein
MSGVIPGTVSLFSGSPGLTSLNTKKSAIRLLRLKPEDDKPDGSALALQYWPETFSDSAAVNYAKKNVPGGSLPLYQWISNGERTLTFQALFTTDVDMTKWAKNQPRANVQENYVDALKAKGLESRNIDIRSALIWLRSFRMPTYNADGTYLPPAKAVLTIPGTRIGLWSGDTGTGREVDSVTAVMTACDIEIRACFPNGNIRIAAVQLTFEEVAQKEGIVNFPGYGRRISDTFVNGDNTSARDASGSGTAVYGLGR